MNKLIKQISIMLSISALIFCAGCADEIDPLMTSLDTSRLFSPLGLDARVTNKTSVRLTWDAVSKATSYNVEFYTVGDEEILFKTLPGVTFEQLPLTVTGFIGATDYLVKLQAVGEDIDPSKWSTVTFKTDPEQIMEPVVLEEVESTSVILRWAAGAVADAIVFNDEISRALTPEELAAGEAIITGLTPETAYKALLKSGTKTRGTAVFTTLISLDGVTVVDSGSDLKAALDGAAEGATIVVMPGTYELGSYALTKSLKVSGYRYAPTINGQFKCGATVTSFEVKKLIVRGNGASSQGQFFNSQSGCDLQTLSIIDCEISNYGNNFIYNNTSGVYGTITISGSYIHDILTSGDGIDFRSGTLGSLVVENTTFANGFRTFLRMQLSAAISFTNCTFYKISCIDDTNNHGLFRCSGGGTFSVSNCLFVETGKEEPTYATVGNFCRNQANMAAAATYTNNYIYDCHNLLVGLYSTATSIGAIEANPGFADAEAGNFTLTNENLIGKAGDPRWW